MFKKFSVLLAVAAFSVSAYADHHGGKNKKMKNKEAKMMKENASENSGTIVDVAMKGEQFSTLVKALKEADLVSTLSGEGPFTVFAPTDAAFAKLPEGALEELMKDKEKLKAVLTYHVVKGSVSAEQVAKLSTAKTIQGDAVKIATMSKGKKSKKRNKKKMKNNMKNNEVKVQINDASVTMADIQASNGVIHMIDTVLMP